MYQAYDIKNDIISFGACSLADRRAIRHLMVDDVVTRSRRKGSEKAAVMKKVNGLLLKHVDNLSPHYFSNKETREEL